MSLIRHAVVQSPHEAIGRGALTPDRRVIITAPDPNTLRYWDAATGRGFRVARHDEEIACQGALEVACAGQSDLLLTRFDGVVRLWELRAGRCLRTLSASDESLEVAALSPDGLHLATGSERGIVRVWEIGGGAQRLSYKAHRGKITAMAYSPDGRHLATGSEDKTVRLADLSGERPRTRGLSGHHGALEALAFSPDGARLATSAADDTVRIWGALEGEARCRFTLKGPRGPLRWSPSGRQLIARGATGLQVWGVERGALHAVRALNERSAYAYLEEGLIALYDRAGISLWDPDLDQTRLLRALPRVSNPWRLERELWPLGGGALAYLSDRGVCAYDLHAEAPLPLRYDARRFLTTRCEGEALEGFKENGEALIYDLRTGRAALHRPGWAPEHFVYVSARHILLTHKRGLGIFDRACLDPLELYEAPREITRVALSPSGRYAALVEDSDPPTLEIWDLDALEPRHTIKLKDKEDLRGIAFSPTRPEVTLNLRGALQRIDLETRAPLPIPKGRARQHGRIQYTPDGDSLMTYDFRAGAIFRWSDGARTPLYSSTSFSSVEWIGGDRAVALSDRSAPWIHEAPTWERVASLSSHNGQIWSARVSPDGAQIISFGYDDTAQIWDSYTGKLLGSVDLEAGLRELWPLPHGRFFARDDRGRFSVYEGATLRGALDLQTGVWTTTGEAFFSPTPIPVCEWDEEGNPWPLAADDPRREAYHRAHNDWARTRAHIFGP